MSQECNQNRSQELALPSKYFPLSLLHFIVFTIKMPMFYPTQNMQVSSALKIDPWLQTPTPCPSKEKEAKTALIEPRKPHSPF